MNAAAKTKASLIKKHFANAFPEVLDNNKYKNCVGEKLKSEVDCGLFYSKNENSVIIYIIYFVSFQANYIFLHLWNPNEDICNILYIHIF